MDELITPERAEVIRRAAARHAGMILTTALRAGWDPDHYFPDEAERDLVLEEVEKIAVELRTRAMVGTRRPCSVCGFDYVVRKGGVVGRHHGVDAAGFTTGERCLGVGRPPRLA